MAINTTSSGPLRLAATFVSSGTFIPPAGTTRCFVTILGASGGQGNMRRYRQAGQGGAGIVTGAWVQVVPGHPHIVTIGAGGASGVISGNANVSGGKGGTTIFDGTISAFGGNGSAGAFDNSQGAGNAGSASAETSLPPLSPSANALVRTSGFTTQATGAQAGGFLGSDRYANQSGASGLSGKVYIFI